MKYKWKKLDAGFTAADDAAVLQIEELVDLNDLVEEEEQVEYVHVDEFVEEEPKRVIALDEFEERPLKKAKKVKTVTESSSVLWSDFDLHPLVQQGIDDLGFEQPTDIQRQTLLETIGRSKDVIGAAETGSGKTLAFGIPVLHFIANRQKEQMGALILTPTRELAIQVVDHLKKAGMHVTKKICAVVGGMAVQKQERLLKNKPDIVVATPGRLQEMMEQFSEITDWIQRTKFLVVDEADRMIEQGHFRDLHKILDKIRQNDQEMAHQVKRQTLVFSATMVDDLARQRYSKKKPTTLFEQLLDRIDFRDKEPVFVNLTTKKITAKSIFESKVECQEKEKDLILYYMITRYEGKTIVFVNSIDAIRRLVAIMTLLHPHVYGLHAEMQQKQRLKNFDRFKQQSNAVLIATDVAARGLDIADVDHVIHYQVPRQSDIYVHRAGRTGRATKEGVSLLLLEPKDATQYKKLMYQLKAEELPVFPIEKNLYPALKKRLDLAKEVDKLQHTQKKKQTNKDWFRKAAEEADIMLSEEDEDEDMNQQKNRKLQQMKQQLHDLIQQPLLPKRSMKFVTADQALTQIALQSKGTKTPLTLVSKAVDDLKQSLS
ncbi:P-loop containing nucleoside triphosphate hydrolase protein [Gorgonomyces haynaldii]|nr:P-loop containing nucleoside triphosphate hydrolase protein [Gorgonomyces haynaldii]